MDPESPLRRCSRYRPQTPVTIAMIEGHNPVAYGVVKDISESGLCVVTQQKLAMNQRYLFRVSFYLEGTIDIEGQVVWSSACRFGRARTRPLGDKWFKALEETARGEGGITNGIQFVEMPLRERQRLQKLLATSNFQITYATR